MKFNILMPCYNDWPSVFKLLETIDKEVSALKGDFSVIIVDDCSKEKMPELKKSYKNIKSVKVINMKKNQGHTRSNATGIRYLSKRGNFDYLILMDADGEDRPEEIKLLVQKVLIKKNISIIARRVKRSEGLFFTFCYHLHKLITLIFTGRNINFGHYSCLTKKDVITISSKKSLWGNYSATVKKFVGVLDSVPSARGKRYVQPSKMSFLKLVIHSFSILAVFKYQALLRSILFLIIFLFYIPGPFSLIFTIFLIIFITLVFLASALESSEKLASCEKNIDNIKTLHAERL